MYLHIHQWSSSEVIQKILSQSKTALSSSLVTPIPTNIQKYSQSPLSVAIPHVRTLASNPQEYQMSATALPSKSSQSISTKADINIGSLSSQTSLKSSIQNQSVANTAVTSASSRQRTSDGKLHPLVASETFLFCDVCAVTQASAEFSHLACRHLFCKGCWELHFECQILQGLATSKFLIISR